MKRRILLDTCALVWLATGDSKLSDNAPISLSNLS